MALAPDTPQAVDHDIDDPVVAAYAAGIDRTLIVEQLRRTPTERILAMMRVLQLSEELRAAIQKRRK